MVNKPKELPKLHRAVWKGDLSKVKASTSSMRITTLNSLDKAKRYESTLQAGTTLTFVLCPLQNGPAFGVCQGLGGDRDPPLCQL